MKQRETLYFAIFILFLSFVLDSCKEPKRPSEIESGTIKHDGLSRTYLYYAPADLPEEAPLVVVLHGFTSSAETIMKYSEMNALAKENKFAVVYPQGTVDADSNTFWNVGYDFHSGVTTDDVDYVVELVKYLQEKYTLSVKNTFLTGMSNGGEMCYLLACKHPEVFSATAPVAGMMLQPFFADCKSDTPIPVFAIFGTKDNVTNFNGDPNNEDGWGAYPGIPFTINYWAEAINYTSIQKDTLPDLNKIDSSFVVRETYLNDQNGNEVLFYQVINGKHDWPGAWGNMDMHASKAIWEFFEKYKQ